MNKSLNKKQKVLYLCTGNSCRSQMAEGFTRVLKGDIIEAYSAGLEAHGLNRYAVEVMLEGGVDISKQKSEEVFKYKDFEFDVVVTVCGDAKESCPSFSGNCKVVHVGFGDPPKMALEVRERGGSAEEELECYRIIRDEIKAFVEGLPAGLSN